MSAKSKAPGTQEKRFAAYLERLASAAGHADRHEPLKSYCTGLLLPIKRKSVEPMAARLAPDNVRRMHQSLHHLVADAPWDDAALLAEVRQYALGAMEANGPIEAWIVDDTGFVKKGTHSVGVARQYCGQVGKPELPGGGEPVGGDSEIQLAGGMATLPPRDLGEGSGTSKQSRYSRRRSISN